VTSSEPREGTTRPIVAGQWLGGLLCGLAADVVLLGIVVLSLTADSGLGRVLVAVVLPIIGLATSVIVGQRPGMSSVAIGVAASAAVWFAAAIAMLVWGWLAIGS